MNPDLSLARNQVNALKAGHVTARDLTEKALCAIDTTDPDLHMYLNVMADQALIQADEIDATDPSDLGPLAGVTISVKDNFCTKGTPTTCASKILEGWVPPYDSTVITKLKAAGAIIIGKTNLDEFAMGSSTENSAYGVTKNPWDTTRVPGGSSGGSAAAVAAGVTPLALGSDTGGSIRQPASLCGIVGLKPTYGLVSRYGLVAFASSLDQIGPFAQDVEDAALLLEAIWGHDPADSTSLNQTPQPLGDTLNAGIEGMRIGIVEDLSYGDGFDVDVSQSMKDLVNRLSDAGAIIESVSLPSAQHGIAVYYLIAPSEASSNLARYDGVRYGLRLDGSNSEEMNARTREAGFGDEVKRRIMIGTYALSAGYYDAFYGQAQKVRTLIINEFNQAFERFDVLLTATSPTTAFKIGERADDPLQMYLSDLCTIPTNLAGIPSVSVPIGLDGEGLPIGAQVLAPILGEAQMFRAAKGIELVSEFAHRTKYFERNAGSL